MFESFEKNPNLNWCIGQYKIINDKNIEIKKPIKLYKNFRLKHYNFTNLITENFIPSMSVFWKKSINKEIGYWDTKIINCNDYDMWLRIAIKYNPIIINKNLSYFRIHQNNASQKNFGKTLLEAYKVSRKYFDNNLWLKLISNFKIVFFIICAKLLK